MTDIIPGSGYRERTNFDFEIESKYYLKFCVLFVNNSYLEFT